MGALPIRRSTKIPLGLDTVVTLGALDVRAGGFKTSLRTRFNDACCASHDLEVAPYTSPRDETGDASLTCWVRKCSR